MVKIGVSTDSSISKRLVLKSIEHVISSIDTDEIEFVLNHEHPLLQEVMRQFNFVPEIVLTDDVITFTSYIDSLVVFWDGLSQEVQKYMIACLQTKTDYVIYFTNEYNLWGQLGCVDAICVYVDGYVDENTHLNVMDSDRARQLKFIFPGIDYLFGQKLISQGLGVYDIYNYTRSNKVTHIMALPYKPAFAVVKNMYVPGFAVDPDISLLQSSFNELAKYIKTYYWKKVLIPKPLDIAIDVFYRTLLSSSLIEIADKVYIVDYKQEVPLSAYIQSFRNINAEMLCGEYELYSA